MNQLNTINNYQLVDNLPKDIITQEHIHKWLVSLDATEKTIATYQRAIKQFYIYLSINNIYSPIEEDIINFKRYISENHKPTTSNSYLIAIKQFFKWLAHKGLYDNIAEMVKNPKINVTEHKKDFLSINQCKELLSSFDTTTSKGLRDKAIISLMLTTGLRTIEISRIQINDISFKNGQSIIYILGKGRTEKTEYIKLDSNVYSLIHLYLLNVRDINLDALTEEEKQQPLFISLATNNKTIEYLPSESVSRIVKESLKKMGLNSDRLTAHSLRHTCATTNLLLGGSLQETSALLRHKNINTTMIYAHDIDRIKNNSEIRIASALFD